MSIRSRTTALLLALLSLPLASSALAASADQFTHTPDAAIWGYNVKNLSNVSPEACATACLDPANGWCVSFDYHKAGQWCDLSDQRAEDIGGLKTDYAGDPLDHYSLKPSPPVPDGFIHTANAAIWGHNVKRLSNVTVAQCAAACDDPENGWCVSFDYHKADQWCDLSDQRATDIGVGGLKTDYAGDPLDHYSRRTNDTVRLIVVADTQGNSNPGVAPIVPRLISDIIARSPDAVLFPGDLVATGTISTFNEWKSLTSALGDRRIMTPGNHDLPGRSATNEDWQKIFNWLPDSQPVPNIATADPGDTVTGMDRMDYYLDITPNIRVISATTDRDALSGESHTHSGGYEIIGGEPKALDWFRSVMALESTRQKEFVFVMTHHSITTQMSELNSPIALTKGTPTVWWQAIARGFDSGSAKADALFTGHMHSYHPNRPDPHTSTSEVIVGTGGGDTVFGATPQRRVHGFMEVVIKDGVATGTFFGDSNGSIDGWSFTEALDTFTVADKSGLPTGELAWYGFDGGNAQSDQSGSPLSKGVALNFNVGAYSGFDSDRSSDVLILDGQGFADSRSLNDHVFQVLGDLRLQLWAEADGELGSDSLDNVLVAFGDSDGALTSKSWQDVFSEELANYSYILSYTTAGHLQMRWEYFDQPEAEAQAKTVILTSTAAVADPQQWHQIEVIRSARDNTLRFVVDGSQLGETLSFSHLPTGGGAGSLYLGALPDIREGEDGGIATFSGKLDDVRISNSLGQSPL
ncbi:PAN domain-containing protein [Endozoicomonas lisbonensis]